MNRDEARELYQKLSVYYPRSYSMKDEARIKATIDDFLRSLGSWEYDICENGAYNWHCEHSDPPTIADLIRECKLYAMEKKPYTPVPEPKQDIVPVNPWKKALDRSISERKKDPNDPHNFLFYILVEYGYEEYMRVKPLCLNARNRRRQQAIEFNCEDDSATIPLEATFASEEEKETIRQLIREGKL